MAYTHGSSTGTHGVRTQGHSNGDELREALRNPDETFRRLPLVVDADTAARGVLERLLGLVVEVNVALETVNEEQSRSSERASLSTGADTNANATGW